MLGMERMQTIELRFFLFFGRARQLQFFQDFIAFGIAEGVDANDGVLAGVLEHFVMHRLVLNLAALIARFHGAQHATAVCNFFKLCQHGFFDQLGELFNDE